MKNATRPNLIQTPVSADTNNGRPWQGNIAFIQRDNNNRQSESQKGKTLQDFPHHIHKAPHNLMRNQTNQKKAFAPLVKTAKWIFASLLFIITTVSLNPTTTHADSFRVRQTVGHWHVSCGTPPGAKSEKCALVQELIDETRPNYHLKVIFLRSSDGKKEVLRIVVPLGVLLPTGLGLKIDNADMGHAPFMKCGKIGCIAEVVATKEIVAKFKTGKNAVFIFFLTPELATGFPVSLSGFSAGYKTLR